jgi:hypothetical protein
MILNNLNNFQFEINCGIALWNSNIFQHTIDRKTVADFLKRRITSKLLPINALPHLDQ